MRHPLTLMAALLLAPLATLHAAEALARPGQPAAALPALERVLQTARKPAFILHAANLLDRLGESARPSRRTRLDAFLKDAVKPGNPRAK